MTEFLQGRIRRPGISIGGAARVSNEYGVLTLDSQRLRQIGERLRRAVIDGAEPEQVILIGDKVDAGFAANPLPGLEYVGLAAQAAPGELAALDFPVVDELPDSLMSLVEENDIIIIDGDRGRVYIAPDAATISRYQAPIRSSRRIFLGSEHLTARTASDNRPIAVIALGHTLELASTAIEQGADGIWVPGDNDFLGPESAYQSSADQYDALKVLAEIAAGKPIFLAIPVERLSLTALARAAYLGTLHLVIDDCAEREDIFDQIAGIEQALDSDDTDYGSVRFEAGFNTQMEDSPPESLDQYSGVCIIDNMSIALMDKAILAAGQAHHARKPLTCLLPPGRDWTEALSQALALLGDRVVVSVGAIEDVKDAIRVA